MTDELIIPTETVSNDTAPTETPAVTPAEIPAVISVGIEEAPVTEVEASEDAINLSEKVDTPARAAAVKPVVRKVPTNSRDFFEQELSVRAERCSPLLKGHLTGIVGVQVTDKKDRYMVDWRGDALAVRPWAQEDVDCTLTFNEKTWTRIVQGDLNPQIALLTDKIKVEGKTEMAVYFFNLVSPQ